MIQGIQPMPNIPVGELAALATALLFSFGSILFTLSGRQIGSPLMNRMRLLIAVGMVLVLHWLLIGTPLPVNPSGHALFWLSISGVVGLVLGDASLFQAFVMVGPRVSMLMMALAPVLSTILAWLFLGEQLGVQELAGIFITVCGIGMVVGSRQAAPPDTGEPHNNRYYLIGLLFGLGGASGQAGGLILSKIGMADNFPPISANLIRMISAALVLWVLAAARGEITSSFRTVKAHPAALRMMLVASLTGPTLGVWLSLVAVQNSPIGIASTLMSLTPIFLIPMSYLVFRERITRLSIAGTVVAFAGSAILFS
jgi:drug/metabolite transporter (DMT)-like permease